MSARTINDSCEENSGSEDGRTLRTRTSQHSNSPLHTSPSISAKGASPVSDDSHGKDVTDAARFLDPKELQVCFDPFTSVKVARDSSCQSGSNLLGNSDRLDQ